MNEYYTNHTPKHLHGMDMRPGMVSIWHVADYSDVADYNATTFLSRKSATEKLGWKQRIGGGGEGQTWEGKRWRKSCGIYVIGESYIFFPSVITVIV